MPHFIKIITPYGQQYEATNDDLSLDELKGVYQRNMEFAQKGNLNYMTFLCDDGKKVTMSGDIFRQCIVEIV
jgi:hypothetical protein